MKKKEKKKNPVLEKMIQNLKDLKNPKFKINNTSFSIDKLPPMEGFKTSEEIRVNLIKSADSYDSGDGSEDQNIVLFTKAIMGLPTEFIQYLMLALFAHIQFKGNGVDGAWADLSGMEDMAFKDFEVIHIYEVLARALFINFHGSFSGIVSAFPGADLILKRLKQKT
ncbi:hypothetical protein KAR91_36160 [Candidatus Pacearchaeota archaeon]|nr:hypothetical protein [Candidatus Pacearchaeota archaeon]